MKKGLDELNQKTDQVKKYKTAMAKLREKADDENNKFEERMKIIQNNHSRVANDLSALNTKIDKYNNLTKEMASKYT